MRVGIYVRVSTLSGDMEFWSFRVFGAGTGLP